jgi:hypothetical protein
MQQAGELKPVQVSRLGEEAMLHFERPADGQLQIRVAGGGSAEVRHEVSLRLSVV